MKYQTILLVLAILFCHPTVEQPILFATANTIHRVRENAVSTTLKRVAQPYSLPSINQPLAVITRGPYLQMASTTAITIRWRTDVATDSRISVGASYNNYTLSATNHQESKEHEVRISGLNPNTKYYYRIGSSSQGLQKGTNNFFFTAPEDTTTQKIRVAAFGDCGHTGTMQQRVLNAYLDFAGSNPATLLLLLGDNAYENGTDAEYQNRFFIPYGSTLLKNHVLFPSPGNHDYYSSSRTSRTGPYYKNFTMPTAAQCGGTASGTEAFYSFDWGNIHFLSLDSYGASSADNTRLFDTLGRQVTWVKQDLAANGKKWTIVFWHHPPYTMGTHNSDTESELIKIRANFIRILERYGVDLVLCGHSHVYERSYLMKDHYGTESSFDTSRYAVSTSSAQYNGTANSCPYTTSEERGNNGIVYVVSGSSAAKGGTVVSSFPHDAMPFSTREAGMFYFEVEGSRLDAKFIRYDGVIYDQFTLMKGVGITTNLSVASGASTTLTASWKGDYRWSTGETTQSITVMPDADKTYTVTDNTNCLQDVFHLNTISTLAATTASIQITPTVLQRGQPVRIHSTTDEAIEASLVNDNGRLFRSFTFAHNTTLETSQLAAGIYFLILHNKKTISRYKVLITE